MDTLKALEWRYAVKKFDPTKKLTDEQLDILLEAVRKTPSSMNMQPWKIVVVENKKLREQIRAVGDDQAKITEASHLLVLASRDDIDSAYVNSIIEATKSLQHKTEADVAEYRKSREGFASRHGQAFFSKWCKQQTFIALGFLLSAAAHNGIDAGPMAGFQPDKVTQLLELDEIGYSATVLIAVGFRDPTDARAKEAKVRLPFEQIVIHK